MGDSRTEGGRERQRKAALQPASQRESEFQTPGAVAGDPAGGGLGAAGGSAESQGARERNLKWNLRSFPCRMALWGEREGEREYSIRVSVKGSPPFSWPCQWISFCLVPTEPFLGLSVAFKMGTRMEREGRNSQKAILGTSGSM